MPGPEPGKAPAYGFLGLVALLDISESPVPSNTCQSRGFEPSRVVQITNVERSTSSRYPCSSHERTTAYRHGPVIALEYE